MGSEAGLQCGRAAIDFGVCLGSEGSHTMLGRGEEERPGHGSQKGASVFRRDAARKAERTEPIRGPVDD